MLALFYFFGLGAGIGGNLYPVWISYDLGIERTASDQFSAHVCGKDGPVNSSERYRRGLYANKIHVKDTVVVPIYRKFNI